MRAKKRHAIVIVLLIKLFSSNYTRDIMYIPLTSSPLSVFSLPYVLYMIANPRYDDKGLYEYSKKVLGIDLICPVKRY